MKLKLLAKMILMILVPAVLGLGGLAITTDRLATNAMSHQIDSDLDQMVTLLASNIENVVGVLGNANVTLAQTGYVQDFVQTVATGTPQERDAALPALTKYLEVVRQNYPRMRDIAILDSKGTIIAHTNASRIGASLATSAAFTTAMQGKRGTSIQEDKSTKAILALLGAPIRNSKGEIFGVSCVNTDLNVLASTTVDTIKLGTTGGGFMLDSTGMVIMHSNRNMVAQSFAAYAWAQQVQRTKDGKLNYEYNGVEKLGFYETLPSLGWKVVISATESDLMSGVHTLSNTSRALTGVVVLIVGLIILLIARQLAGVMRDSAALAAHVASGNLILSPDQKRALDKNSHRSDEIGELSMALGAMIANLADLFKSAEDKTKEAEHATEAAEESRKNAEAAARRAESAKREGMLAAANQLEETLNVIVSASTQLSAQVEQSERGASSQADRMAETATAMEEMNSTVLEVAKNASAASDVSAATRQKAEAGAAVTQQAVRSIQQVQEQSVKLREDMVQLDENAKSISQIMGVISDIADQTNLLALNAAIEAARAGEAGRGFAVVADEVRKLAEKTMASTTDVGNAIRAIQSSAAQSMNQVDSSSKNIEEATDLANQSGANLAEIVTMVDSTADQVRAIATASEQQSSSSEEINESIAQVNTIAAENSRAMGEAARAVADLAHQAQILKNLIEDMKSAN